MSFNQISHINLFSQNNKKLIEFYRSLGIKPFNQDIEGNWYGFNTKGTIFAIEPVSNRQKVAKALNITRNDSVLIQFKANNLQELESMSDIAEKAGAQIMWRMKKASYGIITNFLDPDGNLIEILLEN